MMPEVRIDTPVVTIELKDEGVTGDVLVRRALEAFKEANEIHSGVADGPAFGFSNEKRWTPAHDGKFQQVIS